jgi:hypothetical protein
MSSGHDGWIAISEKTNLRNRGIAEGVGGTVAENFIAARQADLLGLRKF